MSERQRQRRETERDTHRERETDRDTHIEKERPKETGRGEEGRGVLTPVRDSDRESGDRAAGCTETRTRAL